MWPVPLQLPVNRSRKGDIPAIKTGNRNEKVAGGGKKPIFVIQHALVRIFNE